jgi:hypothetical protein
MPLIKSASKKAVGENIKREMHAGKKPAQAVAIAKSVQREAKEIEITRHVIIRDADDDLWQADETAGSGTSAAYLAI